MDPFSITVGALTLIGAVSTSLNALKKVVGAPKEVSEFLSDIYDLGLVIQHVQTHLQGDDDFNRASQSDANTGLATPQAKLVSAIERASASLAEMEKILRILCGQSGRAGPSSPDTTPQEAGLGQEQEGQGGDTKLAGQGFRNHETRTLKIKIKWTRWRKAQAQLNRYRTQLNSLRIHISLVLLAVTTVQSSRTDRSMQKLIGEARSSPCRAPQLGQILDSFIASHGFLLQAMERHLQSISLAVKQQQQIQFKKIEEACLLLLDNNTQGIIVPMRTVEEDSECDWETWPAEDSEVQCTELSTALIRKGNQGSQLATSTTIVPTTNPRWSQKYCDSGCGCNCHSTNGFSTLGFLGSMLGSFSIDMILPQRIKGKCSQKSCLRRSSPMLQATYVFPAWLLLLMVSAKITVPSPYDVHMELRAARLVSDSSLIFRYATEGNLNGIIELFDGGKASAYDIDMSNGTSALVYAVDRGHVSVWRFLLQAGADRFLEGKSKHSSMDVACTKLFSLDRPRTGGGKSTSVIASNYLTALKEDFDIDDYLDRMRFPSLHRIILGIVPADLESYLRVSAAEIDALDYQGRTALAWAAIRSDDASLRTLLRHGADPNVQAYNGDSALHYAVRAETPWCVQPLVDHGADVNARNAWFVNPLSYTVAHRDDIRYLRPLLVTNVDLELPDKHGRTALTRAVLNNRLCITRCLLQHGAQCAIDDVWGNNPIVTALQNRSSGIVDALLYHAGNTLTKAQLGDFLSIARSAGEASAIRAIERLLRRLID